MKQIIIALLLFTAVSACKAPEKTHVKNLDDIAVQYVKLALEIGQYDDDFVDAYYGPEQWKPNANSEESLPYEELKWQTTSLINQLKSIDDLDFSLNELLRFQFLNKQLQAVRTKLDMMSGIRYPFDVESLRLYDVVAPRTELSDYDVILEELVGLLPGEGEFSERYALYRKQFVIPPGKLDKVFMAAINEARKRVKAEIDLPENESFDVEYVTDKPWSGYNWYKGNAHSIIQINTDFPIYIERAIDLACHEGYPGHHVFNVMLEKNLVIENNWHEFQVYPLFSPQSFIAEGSANAGINVAFTKEERLNFEKEILFPLAGIDPSKAEQYYLIQDLRKKLKAVGINIARSYLNSEISDEVAIGHLVKYLQYSPLKAKQRLEFYDRYRSYVINYSLGEEYVTRHLEDNLSEEHDKWELFKILLSSPRTASTL